METRVEFYKKTTIGGYDLSPIILSENDIMKVDIARRIFEISTANVTIDNTDKKKELKDIVHADIGAYDNYTKVKIFFDKDIAFVGVIKEYKYDEDNNIYSFRAEDWTYKIMKTIDCTPHIIFKDTTAFAVIRFLFKHAGIEEEIYISPALKDYPIKSWKIEYNSVYTDILEKIFKTLYARFNCAKKGSFEIIRCYPAYDGLPIVKYKVESIDFITSGEYERNESDMRNKLVVKSNDKDAQAFVCPYLLKHCNGEVFIDSVDEELADTPEKKYNLSLKYFREKLRRSKKFSLNLVDGKYDRDVGDIVRGFLNQSDVQGYTMLNGITTSVDKSDWHDVLEMELLVADSWIFPVKVDGNYNIPPEDNKNGKPKKNDEATYVKASANIPSKFEINKTGKEKLGFVDIEKQPYLEIKAMFATLLETKHYDLIIQDPNKSFYGYKQTIFNSTEAAITKTGLNSCQSISYSGYLAQVEYFKITKPMPGRWYVYLQSDTADSYEVNISVNMEWKKMQIDG
ncbi:hypothetical protein [Clostridium tagluense]|uniref:hypothetical protein n=1 Tax=Clostridium tagluense TaxID=360422 RepID=UPI001CF4BEDB|nr:hypothetical protein [Clostridium tagluense]MCB2300400.1 hypothetical protein [Clostridium tagluense]